MKKTAFALALAILSGAAFAQTSGVIIRDPAGGATRDPALGVGTVEAPLKRDPAGGTMIDDSPRFRAYVVEQGLPSYAYAQPLAEGTILPDDGIVYREIPPQYGAQSYRYTVVNGRTILVEPQTRRIVQIIN